MTVSSTTNRVSYSGDGTSVAFSFPYFFIAQSDLVVLLTDASGNVSTKVLTTDYSISGTQAPNGAYSNGATVTMVLAPAAGTTISIVRDPSAIQTTHWVDGGPDPASVKELAFDKLTLLVQRLKDLITRTVSLPDGAPVNFNPKLPAKLTPGAVITVNTTGDGFQLGPPVATIQSGVGVASKLSLTGAPSDVTVNVSMSPVVIQVLDVNNNLVTGDTSAVTLAIQTGTGHVVNSTVSAVAGVATFGSLQLDTVQSGVILQASRSGIPSINLPAFNVLAVSTDVLQVASTPWRPIPQPHENWTPSYQSTLSYKMFPGEMVPFWFQVKAGGARTLTLVGANASLFTAQFFKPFGQVVDNSDAFKRASLSASPTGTYFDPLNPIPSGANNFTPEVANTFEYVYVALTMNPGVQKGDYTVTFTIGTASVTASIHAWGNIPFLATPKRPMVMQMPGSYANGLTGGYISDATQAAVALAASKLLVQYRVTPYGNSNAFLPVVSGQLNVDNLSGIGASFRQLLLNVVAANDIKFWMLSPPSTTTATAIAAEATITALGLTNMYLYVWDEPDSSQATAAAIKTILDNWHSNSPNTKLFITCNQNFDQSAGAIAAGLTFSSYTNLVLCPVINNVGGSNPAISAYPNGRTGFYSSCQGNCGAETNANSTSGTDTGLVDFAYIDLPMIRRYAGYMLSISTPYVAKIALMIHYDSVQAWRLFDGTSFTNDSKNPWLSARRFNVMGDGTFIYPALPNYKPHTGLAAFPANSQASCPSLRLLYIAHASFMTDLFELYRVAQGTNKADLLVTNPTTFDTTYADYETLRTVIGNALEAGTTTGPSVATSLSFSTQPVNTNVSTTMANVQVSILDQYGALVTTDNTSTVTLTLSTGPGVLSGTLTRTVVNGIATFNDLAINTAGTGDKLHAVSTPAYTPLDSGTFNIVAAVVDPSGISSLLHWFRADSVNTSGSNITQWTNKKAGATIHLTSNPSQNPPTLVSSAINSQPAGAFARASNQLSQNYIGAVATTSWIWVVFKNVNNSANNAIIGSWDQLAEWAVRSTTSKLVSFDMGDAGAGFADGATAADTAWHSMLININHDSASNIYLDKSNSVDATLPTDYQNIDALRIGALFSPNTNGTGAGTPSLAGDVQIAEVVVFGSGFSFSTDYATLKSYVASRYGL